MLEDKTVYEPTGMASEPFEILHAVPEKTAKPPPPVEMPVVSPGCKTAVVFDTDLLELIDTILGVNTDG